MHAKFLLHHLIEVAADRDPASIAVVSGSIRASYGELQSATARFGKSAYGRIYGFVYSGLDAGLALSPLLFGGFMDRGGEQTVLIGVALLQGFAIFTALGVGRFIPAQPTKV